MWLRNWLFWGLVIANLALTLWLIVISWQYQAPLEWWKFTNLAIAFAALAYRYILLPYWLHWYYKQQMMDGKNIQLIVAEQGIDTATDSITGQYAWPGFIGTSEEPQHFVIWVNKVQAVCIPKRAFRDKQQIDEFQEIITRNIENQEMKK